MAENSGISLVPYGPRGKKCKRSHHLPIGDGLLGGVNQVPNGGIDACKLEPVLDHAPKSNDKPTLE